MELFAEFIIMFAYMTAVPFTLALVYMLVEPLLYKICKAKGIVHNHTDCSN